MKKLLLAAVAAVIFAGSPAFAQYYPGNRPQPPQPKYQQPYDHRPGYDRRRGYDQRRNMRPRVCVTSRGSCPAPGYAAPGQNCRCDFPGFGMKRGNVR